MSFSALMSAADQFMLKDCSLAKASLSASTWYGGNVLSRRLFIYIYTKMDFYGVLEPHEDAKNKAPGA